MNELLMPAPKDIAIRMKNLMIEQEAEQIDVVHVSNLLRINPLTWCALHDGDPMCLGGVTHQGIAWMISTPELNRQKRFFLRQSRTVMAAIRSQFEQVGVMVDVCYARSTRWLAWLEFRAVGGMIPLDVNGRTVTVQRFVWRSAT